VVDLATSNDLVESCCAFTPKIDTTIKEFCQLYSHRIKNFHMISGNTEQRIKQILEVISL